MYIVYIPFSGVNKMKMENEKKKKRKTVIQSLPSSKPKSHLFIEKHLFKNPLYYVYNVE